MKNEIPLRPLNDNEKIALEYIRQNPGLQTEEVLNFLSPFPYADDIRLEMSQAVGYLMANGYVEKNKRNYSLIVSDTPPQTEG